jgi:hypothetical protein
VLLSCNNRLPYHSKVREFMTATALNQIIKGLCDETRVYPSPAH